MTTRLIGSPTAGNVSWASDYMAMSNFVAEYSGSLSEVRLYSKGPGFVKVAVYLDGGGTPGALLVAVNAPIPVVAGWITTPITPVDIVIGTTYWIAANSSVSSILSCTIGPSICLYTKANFNGFSFPNPAGSSFSEYGPYTELSIAGWGTPSTILVPEFSEIKVASYAKV